LIHHNKYRRGAREVVTFRGLHKGLKIPENPYQSNI
jgi:hypothetical protein